MLLPATLSILLLYCTVWDVQAVLDPHIFIPDVINKLCSSDDVCRKPNDTSTAFSTEYQSCCADCSCDDDCTSQDNCCFPGHKEQKTTNRNNQQCLFLTSKPPGKNVQHLYRSYFTVTGAPSDGCVAEIKNAATQHNQVQPSDKYSEAPWGSLSPVSSRATGKIYKNQILAECYGENDTVHWTVVLSCDDSDVNLRVQTLAEAFVGDFNSSHCLVYFTYPGNMADLKPHRCLNDVIETCDKSSFNVPEGFGLTQENIRSACTSGFYSPYVRFANYANVFCHICNGEDFARDVFCDIMDKRFGGTDRFISIIAGDITSFYRQQRIQTRKMDNFLVCQNPMTFPGDCLPILCPSGQLRVENGSCIWPFVDLDIRRIKVVLMLTPGSLLPLSAEIELVLNQARTDIYPNWISSPWPNIWTVTNINYDRNSGINGFLNHIFVEQEVAYKIKPFKNTLKSIEKYLKKMWKVSVGNNSFDFLQSLSPSYRNYDTFLVHTNQARTKWARRKLTSLFSTNTFYTKTLSVTKTYFCEQIEIDKREYIFEAYKDVLIYRKTKQVLFDAEFIFTPNDLGNHTVRMCLKDTGFTRYTSRGSLETGNCNLIMIMMVMMLIGIFLRIV